MKSHLFVYHKVFNAKKCGDVSLIFKPWRFCIEQDNDTFTDIPTTPQRLIETNNATKTVPVVNIAVSIKYRKNILFLLFPIFCWMAGG